MRYKTLKQWIIGSLLCVGTFCHLTIPIFIEHNLFNFKYSVNDMLLFQDIGTWMVGGAIFYYLLNEFIILIFSLGGYDVEI